MWDGTPDLGGIMDGASCLWDRTSEVGMLPPLGRGTIPDQVISSVGVHRGIRTAKDAPWTWALSVAQSHRVPFHCPEYGRGPSWLPNGQGASVELGPEFSPKPAGSLSLLPEFGRGPSWPPNGQGACLKLGHEFSPKSSGLLFTARVRSGSIVACEQPRRHGRLGP